MSLNWLKDFVNVDIGVDELKELLSKQSTEVSQVIKQEEKYNNIVVGEIINIRPHKNADKLSIAIIDIGKHKIQVACRANNIREGQKVPVCLSGAIVPNTYNSPNRYTVQEMDFKGEMSEGMMCSEKELEIGEDHSGICILDKDLIPGQSLSSALELNDTILELDFQSNQGYCMSHLGLAREIAALLDVPINWEPTDVNLHNSENENDLLIEIQDETLCPRYSGIIMEGIKTEPSPKWMQDRLRAVGMRPINNIVDVTNYVMLEIGQPMHAFDYDKIAKKDNVPTIMVRKSVEGETIETLDEKEHNLPQDILLIADNEKPIAIAGIVGGENTAIDDNTTKIVLEAANFDAITLRKGSRKLATRTDAVTRFEKNLDPNMTMTGLKRAVELLLEITSGRVVSNVVDVYPNPAKPFTLSLAYEKTNRVIGVEIEKSIQMRNLVNLGFTVEDQDDKMIVTVPTFRRDIHKSIDLIEEIVRIYGYDNIPLEYPLVQQKPPAVNFKIQFIRKLQQMMIGMGFYEIQSHSMVGEDLLNSCNISIDNHIKIINPQSPDKEYMRMTLLPSVIFHTKENRKIKSDIKHFEIEKVFWKNESYNQEDRLDQYALEPQHLTAVWNETPKNSESVQTSYYSVKGVLEAIFEHLKIKDISFSTNNGSLVSSNIFHPTKSSIILGYNEAENGTESCTLGIFGELNPELINKMELDENAVGFELNVVNLMKLIPKQKLFKEFSRFQTVTQDLSFIINEKTSFIDIVNVIRNNNQKGLIKRVDGVDTYTDENIPNGKKSITIQIQIQSEDHTLEQKEIEEIRNTVINTLEKEVEAKLRTT